MHLGFADGHVAVAEHPSENQHDRSPAWGRACHIFGFFRSPPELVGVMSAFTTWLAAPITDAAAEPVGHRCDTGGVGAEVADRSTAAVMVSALRSLRSRARRCPHGTMMWREAT